jgi:uncharacterized membrane protein YeaQ/YmgE (transglycosylase-associated protein family)
MGNLIAWIVLGLVAGLLAKLIMPGKEASGIVITILLGIGGAILGGFIGTRIGFGDVSGFDIHSLALAVGGAVLLLYLYRLLKAKGHL